jgi:hypothetical protein
LQIGAETHRVKALRGRRPFHFAGSGLRGECSQQRRIPEGAAPRQALAARHHRQRSLLQQRVILGQLLRVPDGQFMSHGLL